VTRLPKDGGDWGYGDYERAIPLGKHWSRLFANHCRVTGKRCAFIPDTRDPTKNPATPEEKERRRRKRERGQTAKAQRRKRKGHDAKAILRRAMRGT
jgi:hypothetical protein